MAADDDRPDEPAPNAAEDAGAKRTGKKASGKKAAGRKTSRKKAAGKKTSGRKASGKKTTGKKASGRKASGRKASGKKTTGKKATGKKTTGKKTTGKKTTGKKASGKKTTGKKASGKKTSGKRAAAKKTSGRKAAATTSRKKATAAKPTRVPASRAALPDPADVPRPWLESYEEGVPATYDYPVVPFTRMLDDAAQDYPHLPAVEFLGATLSYRQLVDQVDRFASALRGLGIEKGDRVGIVLPNCPQHVVAIFAILRLGAVVAEANPLYTEEELEHQLNDAGCKAVIYLDPLHRKLGPLRSSLTTIEHYIATGIQDALPFPKNRLFPLKGKKDGTYFKIPAGEGVLRFTELIERSAPSVHQVEVDPGEDVAFLLYTGGTTGTAKGVMLTHHNLVTNAFQGRLWMPSIRTGRENMLCVIPFFHAYGLTVCLAVGVLSAATLTLLPRFELDLVLRTIDKRRPSLFPGVPTMYVAINNAPDLDRHDVSSVRACLSGAAPLPEEVARTFEGATGGRLREGYGLTETSPLTHANPIDGEARTGRIGLPLTDTVCALVDVEDPSTPAPPGGPGELAIFGPQVMKGYWKRPEETAAVLQDGWLLTGDVAEMDEDGYFAIVDRKKDVIIAGGYNIYPRDIEEVLYTHPKVAKAVAVGVPDPYRGETVKAYVVPREEGAVTEAELDEYARDKLAAYKVPTAYELRSELPETMVGKVLRRKLLEEEQARQEAASAAQSP